jgi:HYR domain/NHL repeat
MSFISFARLRMCGVALALLAALSLAAASGASAASFTAKSTAELETDIETANTNGAENTIHLEADTAYIPAKTLTLSNTAHPQIIEGPEGHSATHGPEIEGAAVEPETSELLVLKPDVTATFKWIDWAQGGGLGNPGFFLSEGSTLNLEEASVNNMNGNAIDVHGGATLNAVNSTIAKTTTGDGIVDDGTANLTNSTVAFNEEGGIENAGTLSLTNTIVAENTSNGQHDCSNRVANTSDHSLDSDGTCGVGALSSTNPKLQTALNFDGGPTRLASLTPSSPAIEAADETKCPTIDQRGFKRPAVSGKPCSIGADEYNSTKPVITAATVSPGLTLQATSASGAIVKFTPPSATTTGEAAVESVTCSPETDHVFAVGTTTVSCVAKDGHENESAAATFKVSVMKMETSIASSTLGGIPTGLGVNSEHDVWVAAEEANAVKEFSETGTLVRTLAAPGSPCSGHLEGPAGVAVDSSNDVWVVDSGDDVVREFSPTGTCLLQFGKPGTGTSEFENPRGIAVNATCSKVFIADTGNQAVDEWTPEGTSTCGTPSQTWKAAHRYGSPGGSPGQFQGPSGVALDSHENIYIADAGNCRVDKFSAGAYLTSLPSVTSPGCSLAPSTNLNRLILPLGVAEDASNNLWVANYGLSDLVQFNENAAALGHVGSFGSGEGQFEWPSAVAVDSSKGFVWATDVGNGRLEKWIGADPPETGAPAAVTAPVATHKKIGRKAVS